MHVAALQGHTSVVRQLITAGADVNKVSTRFGDVPLHTAAASGYVDVVELLIKAGADVNKSLRNGLRPLDLALLHRHADVAQMLRSAGATSSGV